MVRTKIGLFYPVERDAAVLHCGRRRLFAAAGYEKKQGRINKMTHGANLQKKLISPILSFIGIAFPGVQLRSDG
jgi:hypothetical protein